MVTSVVIDVQSNSAAVAQTSINTVLTSLAIPAANFLFAITLKYEQKNQTAQIIVFYDNGA